jgi:CBS domain containing-hemolysin-like protein
LDDPLSTHILGDWLLSMPVAGMLAGLTEYLGDPFVIAAVLGIVAGLVCVFVQSLSEAGLLAVSKVRLRSLADEGNEKARLVQRLTHESDDYLGALIVANTLCIMLVSHLTTRLVVHVSGTGGAEGWLPIVSIGMLVFILVFCELTPKSFAKERSTRSALLMARPVQLLTIVSRPLIRALTVVASGIIRLFGGETTRRGYHVTEDDIMAAAEVGEEEGTVEPGERRMIERIIGFGTKTAREIMIPRIDMVVVTEDATADDVLDIAEERGFSRIPVYRETIDNITGIVYVNDILAAVANGNGTVDIRDILREPIHVPETKKLDELFAELQRQRVHLAIVLDEYGGTEGLVTIEDILEELVGEIQDEHDAEEFVLRRLSETEALIDPGVSVADASEMLGIEIPEGDYETLGGFVLARAGHLPEVGERVRADGLEMVAEERDGPRLTLVRVVKQPHGPGSENNEE